MNDIQDISTSMALPSTPWDNLSMAEKAEMMRVAVNNGITNLQDIQSKYNQFAGGGVMTGGTNIATFIASLPTRLKDIAYRIMSQQPGESRSVEQIIQGIKDSYNNQQMSASRYTGSFDYNPEKIKSNKGERLKRDINHLVVYGNTKRQFTPKEIKGFDYSDFLKKNYGVSSVPVYEGHLDNVQEVITPTDYKDFINFLADHPEYGTYVEPTADDIYQDELVLEDNGSRFKTIDDTASYRRSFRRNAQGEPELASQDLIDFGGGYSSKYGIKAGLQGALLSKVINSPVILDQSTPVRFTNKDEDYQYYNNLLPTLQKVAWDRHLLQRSNDPTVDYEFPVPLGPITVKPKKNIPGVGSISEEELEKILQNAPSVDMNSRAYGGKIHIKPSHRGRLTKLKKRTGKTEAELYRTGSPATRKMITFARNARKWKHGLGGNLFLTGGPEEKGRKEVTDLSVWDELAAQSPLFYTIGKAIDPTGISGYGDARKAINQYNNAPSLNNAYTAVMETLGALPIVSKAGKAIKFLQGTITGQGIFDDYNYAQEKMKEYGDELVVDYWDNTVKPRREAERHGEQMKSKMSYTDVHHVPSFRLAPKGSKLGQVISDYDINHRIVKKYKKAFGGGIKKR